MVGLPWLVGECSTAFVVCRCLVCGSSMVRVGFVYGTKTGAPSLWRFTLALGARRTTPLTLL